MQLSFLQPLFDRPGPWATVYFDPAQNDESGAKRRELSVREACRTLEEEGADAATTEAVRDALLRIEPAEDPAGRVVFAAGGEVVLSHRLSRPPQRPIASWASLPRLTPLLELAGQDPVCLVAYIDRTGADFELRGAAGPRSAGQVEGQQHPVHRTASSDWSERHFQLKVENTWERNAGEIAEALSAVYEESGADLVVLAGDPRERPAVHERLPEAVRRVTTETEHGGRAAGSASAALEEAIEEARRRYTRHRVEEALDRFRAGRVGTDRPTEAVEGIPALVEAAREHRIDTLLVRPDGPELDRETWVGARPDQVAARRSDARTLGVSDPTAVRADDALLRAAAVTAADVLVVPPADEDDTETRDIPTGGLGALLRWTYETTPA
ncbi:Vms1/Ankzf1 family peptidyl-tRNA hydrolase [Streptomyces sp. DH24]|uniref:baeRF2 domain-containing protein n=1 Tax=Streptomyces sp. DH24 TaxID=3040123 RepID=UPI002441C398|nr:Vms1/Ankzf1 family peptidyl-tRNA hydrolase [Streptomyces sp. DH24]MDG9717677.1 Vms1/Ankzf1 family peptidyl-tRNA hydrolase [Streptomyces sp. DH24]